jgi:hypothetical protein
LARDNLGEPVEWREARMDGNNLETRAIFNIRYREHVEKNDRLDAIEEAIEDLLEDAGEVRGAREDDGWMNEVIVYDLARVEHWLKRLTALLRRKKAPAATTIEVVALFRAEKVLKQVGVYDKTDS